MKKKCNKKMINNKRKRNRNKKYVVMSQSKNKEEQDVIIGLQMEYAAIRDEVILLMNEQNTHISSLFVMGITILGLGYTLDNLIFFLMQYLILIPFQILINNKQYMMARSGAYIKVFIEPQISNLKWENIVHKADAIFNSKYKFAIGNYGIENRICDYGTFIFSLISLFSYLVYTVGIDFDMNGKLIVNIQTIHIIGIVSCCFGTILSYKLCKKGACFEVVFDEFCNIFIDLDNELRK